MTGNRRVGVLLGGLSAERELSVRSGEAIIQALAERGHDVCPIFVDREADIALRHCRIDVAFLALLGRYGEDGCVQGMLEIMGVPYTGSGVLASALAMNKAKAKEVFRWHNLPTPAGYVIRTAGILGEDQDNGPGECVRAALRNHGAFGFPVIIKPVGEGSSLGVEVAEDELELEAALEYALRYDDEVLVERFAQGKLVTVAVVDGKPVGAIEVAASRGRAPLRRGSLTSRAVTHMPPRISPERYRSALRLATQAYEALGCSGAASVDLVISERGNEQVLEVDTLPALAPTSLFARIAAGAGVDFADLIEEILQGARLNAHGSRRERRALQAGFEGPERRAGTLASQH